MNNIDSETGMRSDKGLESQMVAWTTRGDGIESLRQEQRAVPVPSGEQLLLKITAVALNYRDLLVVGGIDGWRPKGDVVPVSDGAGVVVAVGRAVTRFRVGDRILPSFLPKWHMGPLRREVYVSPVGGPVNDGLLADYVIVEQSDATRSPRTLTDAQAATLPVAGVTAWHAVGRRSRVREGETVLIHGTGGVALFALQFATALGARVVITSSSDEKLARARALGAIETINYRSSTDLAAQILEWSGPDGVDHVIETIGGDNLNVSLKVVKISGTISFIGLISGKVGKINTYEFVTKNVTLHGIETGSRELVEEMVDFIDLNGIQPVIDSMFKRDQIQRALEHLESGKHFGKVVVAG